MLLTTSFIGLFIGSFYLFIKGAKEDNEIYEMCGGFLALTSGLITFIILFALLIQLVSGPGDQADFIATYKYLTNFVERINTLSLEEKTELINKINTWNTTFLKASYMQKSLWLNWFSNLDLSEVNFIVIK